MKDFHRRGAEGAEKSKSIIVALLNFKWVGSNYSLWKNPKSQVVKLTVSSLHSAFLCASAVSNVYKRRRKCLI